MTHAWCRDLSRDERVRAAEDGRDRPLPTLGECIENAFSAGVRDSFRKVEEAWSMIPKSVSASSPVDQENKGDGMRTERVTLEVKHFSTLHAEQWGWVVFVQPVLRPGESVRVVGDEEREEFPSFCPIAGGTVVVNGEDMVTLSEFLRHTTRLTQEAGAAKRQRDAAIRERDRWCAQSVVHERAANAAQARVAEMEAQLKILDDGQPTAPSDLGIWGTAKELSARCQELAARLVCVSTRATAAEARVAELEAASGGGEGEPVAWGVALNNAIIPFENRDDAERRRAESNARIDTAIGQNVGDRWKCIPLYRKPPQPRGWLTGEESDALFRIVADEWPPQANGVRDSIIRSLLARSTPPEVVLDALPTDETGECFSRRDVIDALAAAGVEVVDA